MVDLWDENNLDALLRGRMLDTKARLLRSSVAMVRPKSGNRQEGVTVLMMVRKNGDDPTSKAGMELSEGSAGTVAPSWVRCRWMTLGGMLSTGRSFMPSSKRACLAILTFAVSGSYHRIFLVV